MNLNQTGQAYFEITGISVPLPKNWYYYDEGATKLDIFMDAEELRSISIPGRTKTLSLRYLERAFKEGIINLEEEAKERERIDREYSMMLESTGFGNTLNPGITISYRGNFGNGHETNIHILYLDVNNPSKNTFIRGHEEAHAISYIPDGYEILSDEISKRRGFEFSISKIRGREVAADYNGIDCLVKSGIEGLEKAIQFVEEFQGKRPQLKEAWELYQRRDRSKIMFFVSNLLK